MKCNLGRRAAEAAVHIGDWPRGDMEPWDALSADEAKLRRFTVLGKRSVYVHAEVVPHDLR